MKSPKSPSLVVPLGTNAHRLAQQFAAEQASLAKGKQVYLNTLAVYAVHSYFNWMEIESNLAQGDSWNRELRALMNVADLSLPGWGKVECRPVLPGDTCCVLPPEIGDDRIAYIAVQLSEQLDEAHLLGFTPMLAAGLASEQLQLKDLQPFENLLDYIYSLGTIKSSDSPSQLLVNLNQILQNVFATGWSSLESLLARESVELAYGLRTAVSAKEESFKAGKLINLGMQLRNQSMMLLIGLAPEADKRVRVRMRLCAINQQASLPANLRLALLSPSGHVLDQVQEGHPTDFIQLRPFRVQAGSGFSVQVALDDVSITEAFVL